MSASFSVASSTGSYQVTIAADSFASTLASLESPHLIADEFFRLNLPNLAHPPILLEATEQAKSLDRSPALIEALRIAGANRNSQLVALGGGVIQDISAFIASIYMRGLSWTYIPTTVLAMVDSCIGGKSSINVGPYKNLVGTFHPPQTILIDPTLARTLPPEQFASGLIEAAKICFCRGPESFSSYLASNPSPNMPTSALEQVTLSSLLAKKHFIEIDEFDRNERLLLNFGHTFGHALEGASHYAIPHGIAVGLGILCASAFQRNRGINLASIPKVQQLESHLTTLIQTLPNLPTHLRDLDLDLDEVLQRLASDKKHSTTQYTLILLNASGDVSLERINRTPQLEADLRQAIAATIDTHTE
ncbi:3-dehydroquinate synthase [Granulicella sp. dw_53]|uniref:3-dehydroquinate synthase family protein n=1 Tax=Granulicella sp. dw_53 TaxID=2719792 RepID=UPI001BD61480|nr:3-dehydroquinate synthase [Granulicella sp. dw_53]